MRDHPEKTEPSSSASSSDGEQEDDQNHPPTPAPTPFVYPDYANEEVDDDDEDDDDENLLEIIIDTLTGTSFQVRVSPWETGAGLKYLLQRTQGIPASDQHILLKQQELSDDAPLIDQGVQDGANLKLILSMKGGPINTGRHPPEDVLWREFADYMEVNRRELWEGAPGKQVTLLVLREGENVNLYRVLENQDGTFSPLNQSWGSNVSISGKTDALSDSRNEEESRHRQQMIDLNAQMEALKLKRKERKKVRVIPRASSRASVRTTQIRYGSSHPKRNPNESIFPAVSLKDSSIIKTNTKTIGPVGPRVASNIDPYKINHPRVSRPSTQEAIFEIPRPSFSRGSRKLNVISNSQKPFHVDFSAYKKLDSIRPQQKKGSLSTLTEQSHFTFTKENIFERRKNYDIYRKTLAINSKKVEQARITRKLWSGREAPPPLYSESVQPKHIKTKVKNRLYQSHNIGSLHLQTDVDNRPKTSPEIMVQRNGSAGSVSDRIQVCQPDDKLKELISILNTTRANSQNRTITPVQMTKVSNSSTSLSRRKKQRSSGNQSLSMSLASVKEPPPTPAPPSSQLPPEANNQNESRAQEARSRPGSRRTTPEGWKSNPLGRPLSGKFKITSTPRGFIPATSPVKNRKPHPRCSQCGKKIGLSNTYVCRCGLIFCAVHRYSETHDCTFDYKAAGRKLIELANPLVVPPKLPKI